jgi:uncharacterized membrane protein YeaQ/YmgE (transglycosylase-associated protein family)
MGIVATTILGMVGSFVGGLFASLVSHEPLMRLHSSGLIGSIIGALVVLFIVTYVGRRRALV